MDGEESTKCRAADGITAKDEARHPVAENRDTPCLLCRDDARPGPGRILRRNMLHRREQDADPEPIVEPIPDYFEYLDHSVVEIGTITCFICTWPFATRTS